MAVVLVIDNNPEIASVVELFLDWDHRVISHKYDALAVDHVKAAMPDVIFLNMDIEPIGSFELLSSLSSTATAPPVVAFTAQTEPKCIVAAVKHGAFDVVALPLQANPLRTSFLDAITSAVVPFGPPNDALVPEIIGGSVPTMRLRQYIGKYGRYGAPILVTGASGVGKELVAVALHRLSPWANGPFIPLNCGAIPDTLIESELFGTSKGAFTDARTRAGALEKAHGGTLFLDEVGELSSRAQVKLLRVLETKRFTRIGDAEHRQVKFRIISATNRDLQMELTRERFRKDLFYRLNVGRIRVAPLSERRQDIPVLADYFRVRIAREEQMAVLPEFTSPAINRLSDYQWPGNVRELKNVVWRSLLLSDGYRITADNIDFDD